MKETIENGEMINQNSTQSKTTGSHPAFGNHLTMNIENGLELLVEVLNRQ